MAIKGMDLHYRNEVHVVASLRMRVRVNLDHMRTYNCAGRGQETEGGAGTAMSHHMHRSGSTHFCSAVLLQVVEGRVISTRSGLVYFLE